MLTSLRLTLIAAITGFGLTAPGISSAATCGNGDIGCGDGPSTDGSTVTVTVTGTFIDPGSGGSGGGSGTTTVSVPVPCWRDALWTGKEYYDGVENGSINGSRSPGDYDPDWKPFPGYKKHKNDDKGHWYIPYCSTGDFDDYDDFLEYAEDYMDSHPAVYVEANETPPVDPVPPELLLEAARDSMTMPEPVFDHNPDINGPRDTLVNLDTWFWLQDSTGSGQVTASAAGDSVRVDADLDRVAFRAGTAGSVRCDDTGTRWTRGASSDCTLAFDRPGEHEVTAETAWALRWSYNGTPQGDLDPIGAVWSDVLAVAQSQALVTDVD